MYAKVLTEIVEDRYFRGEKSRTTSFREMTEKYISKYAKSRDSYTQKRLLPFFGEMMLHDITAEDVEDYILERAEQAQPNTVYLEYSLGRRMFNVALKKWKWVLSNPFSDVSFSELLTVDNARDRWLTVEEEAALIEHATPDYLKDIITFALHTGCRRGEILSMSWSDHVDVKRKLVQLRATKKGMKIKTIPMSEKLCAMLVRRSKVRHISGKVFPYEVTAVKDAFERAIKKSGMTNFRFHDLRHTFATRLIQAGVDLYVVKNLLGHKSIKTTERYAHHYPESLRPSIRVLDDCYNSATIGGNFRASEENPVARSKKNPVVSMSNIRGSG